MMFSSRPPFNDDPKPFVSMGRRYRDGEAPYGAVFGSDEYRHSPRPEFDRPQYNPTNPILVEFRARIKKTGEHPYWGDNWDATMDYLDFANDFPYRANDKPEHVQHARKVLTRLANLTKES